MSDEYATKEYVDKKVKDADGGCSIFLIVAIILLVLGSDNCSLDRKIKQLTERIQTLEANK